jgi:hypothetical protein
MPSIFEADPGQVTAADVWTFLVQKNHESERLEYKKDLGESMAELWSLSKTVTAS